MHVDTVRYNTMLLQLNHIMINVQIVSLIGIGHTVK